LEKSAAKEFDGNFISISLERDKKKIATSKTGSAYFDISLVTIGKPNRNPGFTYALGRIMRR
jgi:hypothetical protein